MGEKTGISWTDSTFNPWVGCTNVSPGCDHCYAETYDKRVGGHAVTRATRWGAGAQRQHTSPANWRKPEGWNERAAALAGKGHRHRVFCSSLADVFDDEVPPAWRFELFDLIRRTPNLDWQLLTKRPRHALVLLDIARHFAVSHKLPGHEATSAWLDEWVDGETAPANVWVGVTVEDQQRADERIPELLKIPAAVRFLSCEPLLERLDLSAFIGGTYVALPGDMVEPNYNFGVHWVIVGGESGAAARPFDAQWAAAIKGRCEDAGVAFFFKQMGSNPVGWARDGAKGHDLVRFPPYLRVRQFPKVRS